MATTKNTSVQPSTKPSTNNILDHPPTQKKSTKSGLLKSIQSEPIVPKSTNKKEKKLAIEKNVSKKKTKKEEALITEIESNKLNDKKQTTTNKKIKDPTNKKTASEKINTPPKKTKRKAVEQNMLAVNKLVKLNFKLKFQTSYGQNLYITGAHPLLGENDVEKAVPLHFFNEEFWTATIEWPRDLITEDSIHYNYVLKYPDGSVIVDWGNDKYFSLKDIQQDELLLIDTWNHAGFIENVFYTEAFQKVLLDNNKTDHFTIPKPSNYTHCFKIKSPLLQNTQTMCILGSIDILSNWSEKNPILMGRDDNTGYYSVYVDLTNAEFPLTYKYGVFDAKENKMSCFEEGNNRVLYDAVHKRKTTIINDGYAHLSANSWKGAGVAIPVFSLRTDDGLGIGEFLDIKKLVDWASKVGIKMIQLLPVNDTTATNSWKDSYPYAAISAFALHPIYLNVKAIAGNNLQLIDTLNDISKQLNDLPSVDYEAVIQYKIKLIKEVYNDVGKETLSSSGFNVFFQQNKHWLAPYAAFCYLRDEYGTVDFSKWGHNAKYTDEVVSNLINENAASYSAIAFHYFVQYHLHLQLKDATDYAHSKNIIVKGDIAIGVYRFGADAWQHPDLFNIHYQAGAPPDDFAIKGQNWGFPTYNWHQMQKDGFAWWKQRFEQMNHYFDAFRIDHILGFFRIWSIPLHAVEGIMGYFVPAIAISIHEFNKKGIWFDLHRYTSPFITDHVIWEIFGNDQDLLKNSYLNYNGSGSYSLKPEYATQRLVEDYFATLIDNEHHQKIKQGLFDLISNVILFDVEGNGQSFHFRFNIENTISFRYLEFSLQQKLKELYVDYFFRRQDDFWKKEAMQKLPALKRVTNMMVCGEDLGLVPSCVPDVMKQLGLLSLEIQRMPKNADKDFFHPNDAPYLSVVTPSTHDMSTIRGWWEEDKNRIQLFYKNELGQKGEAPYYCEAWINKAIVAQHLYSPAMWSVFQLQDLMGIHEQIKRDNPMDEQINIPANPKHYWRYRMHHTIDQLINATDFTEQLSQLIKASGR